MGGIQACVARDCDSGVRKLAPCCSARDGSEAQTPRFAKIVPGVAVLQVELHQSAAGQETEFKDLMLRSQQTIAKYPVKGLLSCNFFMKSDRTRCWRVLVFESKQYQDRQYAQWCADHRPLVSAVTATRVMMYSAEVSKALVNHHAEPGNILRILAYKQPGVPAHLQADISSSAWKKVAVGTDAVVYMVMSTSGDGKVILCTVYDSQEGLDTGKEALLECQARMKEGNFTVEHDDEADFVIPMDESSP